MSNLDTRIEGRESPVNVLEERDALNRALLAASASLAEGQDPEAILRCACDVLATASPRIRLAWMYLGDPNDITARPTYAAGPARACADEVWWGGGPRTRAWPGHRSLNSARPMVANIRSDATLGPGRERALENRLETCVYLPFGPTGAKERGVLVAYADQPDYFQRVGLESFLAFARLARVALEQAAKRKQLQDLATIDGLTGLLNRGALQKILEREHAQSQRHGRPYSLLLLDVDRFKTINDTYGHAAGDKVLAVVAGLAQRSLREGDWVGRWGGDEFLCLLPDADDEKGAVIAERLRRQVAERPADVDGRRVPVTLSIGLAHFPYAGDRLDKILTSADAALYGAKRRGRNRVVSSSREARGVFSIAGQLESALQSGNLQPSYQPIVELQTGSVVGEEALARIIGQDGRMLEASAFIQAATQLRMVKRIDSEIMRAAVSRWSNHSPSGQGLACFVNVSSDLLRHPELVSDVLQIVADRASDSEDARPFVVELTEWEFLHNAREVRQILAPFLDYGIRLAIDDFGSGYSSFQYLTDLPVSYLKIDGELIRRVGKETRVRAIIKGIRDIAVDLNLTTLAEWVEDESTAHLLQDLGVNWGQGYHFGQPKLHLGQGNVLSIR
ncbi:MAG: putative bifunctional diguanylate cyclase/phosphodiesterase [Acidiferrobacterales bacterium]